MSCQVISCNVMLGGVIGAGPVGVGAGVGPNLGYGRIGGISRGNMVSAC